MYQHCQTQVQTSNVYNLPTEVKAEADTVGAVEGVGHWMVSESINHLRGNAIILLSEVGEDLSSGRDLQAVWYPTPPVFDCKQDVATGRHHQECLNLLTQFCTPTGRYIVSGCDCTRGRSKISEIHWIKTGKVMLIAAFLMPVECTRLMIALLLCQRLSAMSHTSSVLGIPFL